MRLGEILRRLDAAAHLRAPQLELAEDAAINLLADLPQRGDLLLTRDFVRERIRMAELAADSHGRQGHPKLRIHALAWAAWWAEVDKTLMANQDAPEVWGDDGERIHSVGAWIRIVHPKSEGRDR